MTDFNDEFAETIFQIAGMPEEDWEDILRGGGVPEEEIGDYLELVKAAAENDDTTPEEAAMLGDKDAYVQAVAKETGIEKGDKPRDALDTPEEQELLKAASSMAKNDNAEVEVKAEDKDGDGDPDKVTMESETVTEKVPEEKDNSSEKDDEPNDSINVGNIASMLAEHKFG